MAARRPVTLYDQYERPLERFTNFTFPNPFEKASPMAPFYLQGTMRSGFLQNAWAHSCIVQSAMVWAQLHRSLWRPLRTVGKSRKPGWEEVTRDPLLDKWNQPNRLMSGFQFQMQWYVYLMTGGNVWVREEQKNSEGIPQAYYLYSRDQVSPRRDDVTKEVIGWDLSVGTKTVPLGLDQLTHWALPTHLGNDIIGIPPMDVLAIQLDADYLRVVYDREFHANNAEPSAVLTYKDGELLPEQRQNIRESWEEVHGGPGRAGRLAVIGGNYEFKILQVDHANTQFVDVRRFGREEVAAAHYGFPVALLNGQEGSALGRETLEIARQIVYESCVGPFAEMFLAKWNPRHVKPYRPTWEMAFDTDLLPVVITSQLNSKSEIFERFVQGGIPVNNLIKGLDLPFDPVQGGDVGYFKGNVVPVDPRLAREPPDPEDPEDADAAMDPEGDRQFRAALRPLAQLPGYLDAVRVITPLRTQYRQQLVREVLLPLRRATRNEEDTGPIEEAALEQLCSMVVAGVLAGRGGVTPQPGDLIVQSCGTTELDDAVEALVRRGLEIVARWQSGIAEERAISPDRLARYLASRLLTWGLNAGRASLGVATPVLAPPEGCPMQHQGQYPGDHRLRWDDVVDCQCAVAPAEGAG